MHILHVLHFFTPVKAESALDLVKSHCYWNHSVKSYCFSGFLDPEDL